MASTVFLNHLSLAIGWVMGIGIVTASEAHWAFEPLQPPEVPKSESQGLPSESRNPIDAFLADRGRSDDSREVSLASPDRLLRRLSLDLRGLPVSLAERRVFLDEWKSRPDAFERTVDRWLASSHYGERRAQDWLDLARYADTTGHAADQPRTMWLFRDWVIDALNADMPFDQFTVEQLAGDRLPQASEAQRIASGFHRNSMQALGNNPRKEEFRVRGIVDRLDVTGQVWLGLSLSCAECHDHKHDPISQKEYYELFAIFNQVPHYGEKFEVHGPRLTVTRERDGQVTEVVAQVMDTVKEPRMTHVHLRGSYEMPGERVRAALPAVLSSEADNKPMDRLAFARWMVSSKNPLTARVTANRLWARLFGRGLVTTVNDFGLHGARPSHPELLEWLALRLRSGGWSLKRLHRDLLETAAYRQSTTRHAGNSSGRAVLARFRLSAEVLRDQALAVSGLLVDELGGPSVFPPQPKGVGEFRDTTAGSWEESVGGDRFRRSLYTFWQRMAPHPGMATFDAPSREWCVAQRSITNTPLQALAMMNDPAMVEAQRHFADTLDSLPLPQRIRVAFQRALCRPPDPEEQVHWERALMGVPPEQRSDMMAAVLFNLDEFLSRE